MMSAAKFPGFVPPIAKLGSHEFPENGPKSIVKKWACMVFETPFSLLSNVFDPRYLGRRLSPEVYYAKGGSFFPTKVPHRLRLGIFAMALYGLKFHQVVDLCFGLLYRHF